ncbi:MAG: HAD family phosphatase [Chlamydiota bacterium]|nr:HAD family phosphatase [Chlamydiota bacterium]
MMDWIHNYDLFLFDFDGLLVNTEMIHYRAYKKMCADRGFNLDWDFAKYIEIAHYSSEGLERHVYGCFPELQEIEPNWPVLYAEKKAALIGLFHQEPVPLMPGVEKLLNELQKAQKKRCVVTHSDIDLVTIIREKNPVLNTIPEWITRFDYNEPKPHPECYIKAIDKFAVEGDRVVGFEDTPRGITALRGSIAKPVIITEIDYPELREYGNIGVSHYKTFEELFLVGV